MGHLGRPFQPRLDQAGQRRLPDHPLPLGAEPLNALRPRRAGVGSIPRATWMWRCPWLLKNHPHDSICGCSIDAVHEDMKFRFAQAEQIGNRLTTEATRKLAASVQGDVAANEVRVTVFNPLPTPFDGVADLRLEIPPGLAALQLQHGRIPTDASVPHLFGPDGSELPYQRLGQATDRSRFRTVWRLLSEGPQGDGSARGTPPLDPRHRLHHAHAAGGR